MEYHADVAWPSGEITMELSMAEILDLLAGYNFAGGEVVGSSTLDQRPEALSALDQRAVFGSLTDNTLDVAWHDLLGRSGRATQRLIGATNEGRVHAAGHDLWRLAD